VTARRDPLIDTSRVNELADSVGGVNEILTVSPDGLELVASSGLGPGAAAALAELSSAIVGFATAICGRIGGGALTSVTIEMEQALLAVAGLGDGSAAVVLADDGTDLADLAGVVSDLAAGRREPAPLVGR
jgi:predicted regulator of Ras-like GTPase activity (Roadblock/LC7/MglB family)